VAHHHQPEPPITSSHPSAPRTAGPAAGERVELARYTVKHGGERILFGQRVNGRVRVTDRPAGPVDPQNRALLVDNELQSHAELDALITDYLARARTLQFIPAAATPFDLLAQRVNPGALTPEPPSARPVSGSSPCCAPGWVPPGPSSWPAPPA
jgi:hypothetical protein